MDKMGIEFGFQRFGSAYKVQKFRGSGQQAVQSGLCFVFQGVRRMVQREWRIVNVWKPHAKKREPTAQLPYKNEFFV